MHRTHARTHTHTHTHTHTQQVIAAMFLTKVPKSNHSKYISSYLLI